MRGISLPISAIIMIALGLLVLVVMSAVFIKGGGGFTRVTQTQTSLQECQAICSQIRSWAMSFDSSYLNGKNSRDFPALGTFYNKCYKTGILTNCTIESMDGVTCYLKTDTDTMEISCPS